jgi:hypothetical protein
LRIGLGRAVLYAQNNYSPDLREIILNGCLHHLGYDPQTEGHRGVYMYDIISCTPEIDFYVGAIIDALNKLIEDDDGHDIQQIYRLVGQLTKEGNERACRALYHRFDTQPTFACFVGANTIVDADGWQGFKHVAERLNDLLRSHGNRFSVHESGWCEIDASMLSPLEY